jgi:uncharacterized protein (TIGR02145 family)
MDAERDNPQDINSNNYHSQSSSSLSSSSSSVAPSSSSKTPSSSSSSTQSGIVYGTPVTYGGETYQTIVIGAQTWMARNLNYDAEGSKCYNNDPANCNKYGRLYDWATAMAIDTSCNAKTIANCGATVSTKHRGVCPSGWHLPSDAEWTTLTDYVGGETTAGTKLKARSGWNSGNGTDDYGFAALPGGDGDSDGYFDYVGYYGTWWSATGMGSLNAYYRDMGFLDEDVYRDNYYKDNLFSVRCVKD